MVSNFKLTVEDSFKFAIDRSSLREVQVMSVVVVTSSLKVCLAVSRDALGSVTALTSSEPFLL